MSCTWYSQNGMNPENIENFLNSAAAVLRRMEVYKRSGAREVSPEQLEVARRGVERMRAAVRGDSLPSREARDAELTHLIMDSWPLGHPLGNAITALERDYRQL